MSDQGPALEINAWLASIGLAEYSATFAEHHIEQETLSDITDADLRDIGISSLGHRKKLLSEIRKLASAPTPETPAPAATPARTVAPEPPKPAPKSVATVPPRKAPAIAPERQPEPEQPPATSAASSVETAKPAPALEPSSVASSQSSEATTVTPPEHAHIAPPRRTIWTRIMASKFLFFSIVAHILFGIGATYFIVQKFSEKRKVTFAGGPPTTNPSKRALEHKISMAQKQKSGGSPPQAKRIATTGLSALTLPDMPMTTASTVVPGMNAGMGGAGFGMGMGFGPGMGGGFGGGGGGGGGGMTLFGFRGSGPGLVGTFYDLKLTRAGKPSNMATVPNEKVNMHSPENNRYVATLKRFVENWSVTALDNFYRAKNRLVTTQIFIPPMSADAAPQAFGVGNEGRRWIVYYRGEIIPPRTGRFRFVGRADDVLIVRCGMRNVLDASAGPCRVVPEANDSSYSGPNTAGKWINMRAGEALKLEVVIGELPGGAFCNYLMIEEERAERPPGAFPVFQLRQMAIPGGGDVPAHHNSIIFGAAKAEWAHS